MKLMSMYEKIERGTYAVLERVVDTKIREVREQVKELPDGRRTFDNKKVNTLIDFAFDAITYFKGNIDSITIRGAEEIRWRDYAEARARGRYPVQSQQSFNALFDGVSRRGEFRQLADKLWKRVVDTIDSLPRLQRGVA